MRSALAALALMASPALATGIEITVSGQANGVIKIDLLEDVAPEDEVEELVQLDATLLLKLLLHVLHALHHLEWRDHAVAHLQRHSHETILNAHHSLQFLNIPGFWGLNQESLLVSSTDY